MLPGQPSPTVHYSTPDAQQAFSPIENFTIYLVESYIHDKVYKTQEVFI